MLEGMQEFIGEVGKKTTEFIKEKPITSAGLGVGILTATGGIIVGAKALGGTKKRSSKKKKKKTKKGRSISRDRKFISKQKHEIRRRRKKKPAKIYKKKGKYWSRKPLRKSRSKKRFVKGSKEAKAYMKKLRNMRK